MNRAKIIAPIAVLAVAGIAVAILVQLRPAAEPKQPERVAPLVGVVRAMPTTAKLAVRAQGTVEPRTESDLVTETAGRIVWVSPQLASGGFFAEGETLLRIDSRDNEIALDGARAALARAQSNLSHARRTLDRQRSIRRTGASSQARLDEAVFNSETADAGLREAKVAVERAELDLERTQVKAPFAGRVRDKRVDVGQFVGRGVSVARIFSVDFAEIRLPIDDTDLAYLSLQARPRAVTAEEAPRPIASVTLRADYAGAEHEWAGYVVRTEGALDARTRMVTVVARVDDPYALLPVEGEDGRTVLPIGLFVEAEIEGREIDDVYVLPPSALHRRTQVLVVDDDDRLNVRTVDVLRVERDRALVRAGLRPGERVIVTSIEVVTEGMAVRAVERPAASTAATLPSGVSSHELELLSGRWAS